MAAHPYLLLAVLLAGPADRAPPRNQPKFKADLTVLCDVAAKSGAAKIKDASDRAEKIAEFLTAQDFGDEYTAFFNDLAGQPPEEKPAVLLTTARLAGLTSCAFAESSRKELLAEWQPACANGDASICEQLKNEKVLWEQAKKVAAWPKPDKP
jgi:hypothetical protein